MSYPPYNPHDSGMYPPPQQATTPLSYPIYPGSAAPAPPSGYPQSMPMPSANPYPSQQPSYPPQQPGYPPYSNQPSPYPSQPMPSSYPSQPSPYPPTSSPYPSQPGQSPFQPQQSSPYPSQLGSSVYPSQQTSSPYPSQPSAYPSQKSQHYGGYDNNTHGNSNPYSSPPYNASHSGQVQQPVKKGTPTVYPANPFDPRSDAEILRKAMKGFGTDEKAIIEVLANRTNAQRQEIAVQFKTLFGKDLIKDLKSETSGNFEDLLVALMTPIPYFLAKEVHDAISGIGTDEETLIEILCTSTNSDIHVIRDTYARTFGVQLEDALMADTSGSFRRLLVSLCQGNRSENYYVDRAAAQSDAQALLRAGELRLGTDESTFNAILCSRSYPQLRAVLEEYQNITGHDFTKAIRNEFSGDIQDGLLAIVNSVRDRSAYFAERLYKSMKGFGTKDRTLQRIVALRCEIDMVEIKNSFQANYGNSLVQFIQDDCSGDYKRLLVALIS